MDDEGCWQVEEACLNAWPARRHVVLGGWLLRISGGRVRRPNSVSPLRGGRTDPEAVIAACETVYRAHGQTPLFRVLSIADEMDVALDRRGYGLEAPSLVLWGEIAPPSGTGPPVPGLTISIDPGPGEAWLAAHDRLTGDKAADCAIFRETLGLVALPAAFAAASVDGSIVSQAFGAVQGGLLVIEAVATDPAHRGRGLARATLNALMAWGREQGARRACLQVLAGNDPALGLYRALGLDETPFAYHYRRAPAG